MIFSNKYIKYTSKSKYELYTTLILFKILSNKNIVQLGKKLLQIGLKLNLPILSLIKKTVFRQFCGGEDIIESNQKIAELGKYNIQTILDYSVEGKNDDISFKHTYNEILKNLEEAQKNNLIPFCVFKITGIARFSLLKKINANEALSETEEVEFKILINRL